VLITVAIALPMMFVGIFIGNRIHTGERSRVPPPGQQRADRERWRSWQERVTYYRVLRSPPRNCRRRASSASASAAAAALLGAFVRLRGMKEQGAFTFVRDAAPSKSSRRHSRAALQR
jgi:hypothetical protein